MRCVAITGLALVVAACNSTRPSQEQTSFAAPNQLMGTEIENRIAQIPFQHREDLFNNLLWLAQRGEQAIPALLDGLEHDEAKVRSNSAWILGQIRDRRVIPYVRKLATDDIESVRLEAARTLVTLGDMNFCPVLIEGLDSDKIQVRYLCHEALKGATGRDFSYDHLADDLVARNEAVYRWRRWWGEQSGDDFFAASYADEHGIETGGFGGEWQPETGQPAAPGGETVRDGEGEQLPPEMPPVDPLQTPPAEGEQETPVLEPQPVFGTEGPRESTGNGTPDGEPKR